MIVLFDKRTNTWVAEYGLKTSLASTRPLAVQGLLQLMGIN